MAKGEIPSGFRRARNFYIGRWHLCGEDATKTLCGVPVKMPVLAKDVEGLPLERVCRCCQQAMAGKAPLPLVERAR